MTDPREDLEERLRRLRFGDPDPALRTRTLNAVREALARRTAPGRPPAPGWLARLTAWRTEALCAAAIVACLVFLARPGPETGGPSSIDRRAPASLSADGEALIRELGLTGDLANHVGFRLALQRDPRSKRRIHPHDFHRKPPTAPH